MNSIVIAEKPSQKKSYDAAVGTTYGRVFAARGHLFSLAQPEEENDAWKVWTIGLMRPDSGFYKTILNKKDADIKRRYYAIRDAAKNAQTIYIATDPDREGEGIGGNIINQLRKDIGWTGEVLRVLPLGRDPKSVQEQFSKARPGGEYKGLFQSYLARSQGDQIFNLSATRSASKALLPEGVRASLSVGRVLTPTFGMVCRRYLEIEGFQPQKYFLPWIEVEGGAGVVRLTHRPKDRDRLFDRGAVDSILSGASSYSGEITVIEERKKQSPPHLFSLSSLQVVASTRLKWPMAKTTDILQQLYEKHKVATYPRSSEVSLPEAEIDSISSMKAGALALPFIGQLSWADAEPVVRKSKGGFSDKDLKGAAHYAIVPNVNTADQWAAIYPNMSADEQQLFELIVRRYISVIGPDRVYDSTRLSITSHGKRFGNSGTVEVSAGWQEVAGVKTVKEDDNNDGIEQKELPPFKDGDPVKAVSGGLADQMTKPPAHYSDANLGIAMIEAWKLVDDPDVRKMMKETEGIGTVGTRKDIVKNLLDRGFISSLKGKVVPTSEGLKFFHVIEKYAPDLLDVAVTGQMEIALEKIKSGEFGARTAVDDISLLAQKVIDGFIRARDEGVIVEPPVRKGGKGKKVFKSKAGKPTEGMKRAARAKANKEGKKAPPIGVLTSYEKCRSYLGPPPRGGGSVGPTDKQMALARKLSKSNGVAIPDDAQGNKGKMSAWIDLQIK